MNTTRYQERIGRYIGWADGCHQWEWIDIRGNWSRDTRLAQVFDTHEEASKALDAIRLANQPSQSYITLCLVE